MTEAQAAAFRLFTSVPRDRVTTHQKREATFAKNWGEIARIRGWVRQHMRKMGPTEMARELNIPVYTVHNHLQKIRGTGKHRRARR